MINTVLFDLDGTIIDTNELIISTFMHVIQKNALNPHTREEIIPHMGLTLEQQLRTFSGREDVADLVLDYRTYNREHHDAMVAEFPKVKQVIQTLYAKGIRMGIVTTKIRPTTLRALEMFDLLPYMERDAIITVQDVTYAKPHPEPVLKALQQLNADPASTLMVGDSAADLLAARAAGVKSAAVAWSIKGIDVLKQYNPDYILNNMTDLYDVLGMELEVR